MEGFGALQSCQYDDNSTERDTSSLQRSIADGVYHVHDVHAHRNGALSATKVELRLAGKEGFVAEISMGALVTTVVIHWFVARTHVLLSCMASKGPGATILLQKA